MSTPNNQPQHPEQTLGKSLDQPTEHGSWSNRIFRERLATHPDDAIRQRGETAASFMGHDLKGAKLTDHMQGTNFNRDVNQEQILAGTILKQYQGPPRPDQVGGPPYVGQYFTMHSDRSELGIQGDNLRTQNRTVKYYYTTDDITALKSTAADIESFEEYHANTFQGTPFEFDSSGNKVSPPESLIGKTTGELNYGGGDQYFIRREDVSSSIERLELESINALMAIKERQAMARDMESPLNNLFNEKDRQAMAQGMQNERGGEQGSFGLSNDQPMDVQQRQDMVQDMGGQLQSQSEPSVQQNYSQSSSIEI